jgi:hypothetical protein
MGSFHFLSIFRKVFSSYNSKKGGRKKNKETIDISQKGQTYENYRKH